MTVTITNGVETYTQVADENGLAVFNSLETGEWTVTITDGEQTASQTVTIDADLVMTFFQATISVVYPAGATCKCSDGTTTLTAPNTTGSHVFTVPNTGTWTVTATNGTQTVNSSVSIVTEGQGESITLAFFAATIEVTYPEGSTCTCSDGSTTLTAPDTTGSCSFIVPNTGAWTVSCTDGTNTDSGSVSITATGQSESVTLEYIEYLKPSELAYKTYTHINGTISVSGDTITFGHNGTSYYCEWLLTFTEAIDVSKYSTLKATFNVTSVVDDHTCLAVTSSLPTTYYGRLNLPNVVAKTNVPNSVGTHEISVSLSAVSSSVYVVVCGATNKGTITNIRLE